MMEHADVLAKLALSDCADPSITSAKRRKAPRGGYKCGKCGKPKKGHVCTGGSLITLESSDDTEVTSVRIEQLKEHIGKLRAQQAQLQIENNGFKQELASYNL